MAQSAEQALAAYKERRHSVILTDYQMEPINGLQLISQIRQFDPEANCLIMSGMSDAIVTNYVTLNNLPNVIAKPIRPASLTEQIRIAFNRHRGASERLATVAVANRMDQCIALLGHSYEICQVRKQLAQLVDSYAPLVLEGPTGIGKPEIARFIHKVGPFSQSHFVECVCSDMTTEAMSQLVIDKDGNWGELLREAHHGTLVLFNIQRLPLLLQEALAREFQSLIRECHVITMADGRLDALLDAGQLDANLYFQLSVENLHIPALSERPADIEEIVRHITASPYYCESGETVSVTEVDLLVAELRRVRLDRNLHELIERVRERFQTYLQA
jgi:DNA-binding NtrC family response regulator